MADINDYGMKISRQGFDVNACADNQLLFSSSFKLPLVVQSGIYKMGQDGHPDYTNDQTLFTHSLGYRPLVLLFCKDAGSAEITLDSHRIADNNTGIFIGANTVYYKANTLVQNMELSYYVCNIDMDVDYSAPTINTDEQVQGATPEDYGFKVSKAGKDVSTAGLLDLASFSGNSQGGVPVRHQLLHKVSGWSNHTTNSTRTVAHGLGYPPMFIIFQKNSSFGDDFYCKMVQLKPQIVGMHVEVAITFQAWADANNINIFHDMGGTENFRIAILKDPLF